SEVDKLNTILSKDELLPTISKYWRPGGRRLLLSIMQLSIPKEFDMVSDEVFGKLRTPFHVILVQLTNRSDFKDTILEGPLKSPRSVSLFESAIQSDSRTGKCSAHSSGARSSESWAIFT